MHPTGSRTGRGQKLDWTWVKLLDHSNNTLLHNYIVIYSLLSILVVMVLSHAYYNAGGSYLITFVLLLLCWQGNCLLLFRWLWYFSTWRGKIAAIIFPENAAGKSVTVARQLWQSILLSADDVTQLGPEWLDEASYLKWDTLQFGRGTAVLVLCYAVVTVEFS